MIVFRALVNRKHIISDWIFKAVYLKSVKTATESFDNKNWNVWLQKEETKMKTNKIIGLVLALGLMLTVVNAQNSQAAGVV